MKINSLEQPTGETALTCHLIFNPSCYPYTPPRQYLRVFTRQAACDKEMCINLKMTITIEKKSRTPDRKDFTSKGLWPMTLRHARGGDDLSYASWQPTTRDFSFGRIMSCAGLLEKTSKKMAWVRILGYRHGDFMVCFLNPSPRSPSPMREPATSFLTYHLRISPENISLRGNDRNPQVVSAVDRLGRRRSTWASSLSPLATLKRRKRASPSAAEMEKVRYY